MATTTTNYSLLKPAATDSYNHLVYDNPNMDTIDATMKANSDAAITSATCIKSGTTHTIVRSNTDAPVFRFTATGDWNSGDTMIVDGVTVSPFLPNGEALVNGAFVINSDIIATISGSRVTVYSNGINFPTINANEVVYDNTTSGLTAVDVQAAIDEIDSEIDRQSYNNAGTTQQYTTPITITVPEDGYVQAIATGSATNIYCTIGISGANDVGMGYISGQNSQSIMMYVRKGMKVIFGGGGTSPSFVFRYVPFIS